MARVLLLVLSIALVEGMQHDDITDEQYYHMPRLFHLDDWTSCMARHELYCVGSFELASVTTNNVLYDVMKAYSSNWVDHYNHTRLHRGLCLEQSCEQHQSEHPQEWFQSCVNASMTSTYGLSARLYHLEYCSRTSASTEGSSDTMSRAFAALLATLFALSVLSTALDFTLPKHVRPGLQWSLSWSVRGCWRELRASPAVNNDFRVFDGIRVVSMLCVIMEHVCWVATLSYVTEPRFTETKRRALDVMLLTNSTLVVQVFFMMSTFLLANKMLNEKSTGSSVGTFFNTMLNRVIRISPAYWTVVWFAASAWERLGAGPLWAPLVGAEAALCRRKWWTHVLYLNNVVYPDDKCLIQTWYLAADLQLYAGSLILILLLRNHRHFFTVVVTLLSSSLIALGALSYIWKLLPTFILHSPESVRAGYVNSPSFNVLYQSPAGNVPGALAGLLLALAHKHLPSTNIATTSWFRWSSWLSFPLAVCWAALSPRLLVSEPSVSGAATLAVLERPLFVLAICYATLGGLHGVDSPWRRFFAWSGWALPARLSFAALLLHLPINKTLVASRLQLKQLDRVTASFEWCGMTLISYLLALPLVLLVELPALRLQRALRGQKKAIEEKNNNTKTRPH